MQFRAFLEYEEGFPATVGFSELSRLAGRHHLFGLQTTAGEASKMMKNQFTWEDFVHSRQILVSDIEKWPLTEEKDSLVILALPRRWDKEIKPGRELFARMIGETGLGKKYVWGAYSMWNQRTESHGGEKEFYKNPYYHANDDMLREWLSKHPVPKFERPALPLDKSPRVNGPYQPLRASKSFHGYREDPSVVI